MSRDIQLSTFFSKNKKNCTLLLFSPGVLLLEDCLSRCLSNSSCRSLNYETGLCVLFHSDATSEPGESRKQRVLLICENAVRKKKNTWRLSNSVATKAPPRSKRCR